MKKYDLICVRWDDSRQPYPSWVWEDDFEHPGVSQNITVGWLLHKDKDSLALAQSLGDVVHDRKQAGGITTIAARSVVHIEVLKPSASSSAWVCPAPDSARKRKPT